MRRHLELTRPFVDRDAFNPDLPVPTVAVTRRVATDGFMLEELALCTHVGTHMDAPSHVLEGAPGVDDYPLDRLSGRAVIADVRGLGDDARIGAEVLEDLLGPLSEPGCIVLFLTGWGDLRGPSDRYINHSPWLDGEGADWLVDQAVVGVVIDHFSISGRGPVDQTLPAHTQLLGAGIWIVEDALLPEELLMSAWRVTALPLRLAAASGAPTRVIAEEIT